MNRFATTKAAKGVFFGAEPKRQSARSQLLAKMAAAEAQQPEPLSLVQPPSPQQALEEIYQEFRLLQATNPFLSVSRTNPGDLNMAFTNRPEIGFKFVAREDLGVQFECPSSEGDFRIYRFDPSMKAWVSEKDGHDMHGLLIRDLLPFLTGLPSFAFKH